MKADELNPKSSISSITGSSELAVEAAAAGVVGVGVDGAVVVGVGAGVGAAVGIPAGGIKPVGLFFI